MFLVEDFYHRYAKRLHLKVLAARQGLKREVLVAEIHRGGLTLSGYLDHYAKERFLAFGRVEMEYLKSLTSQERKERISQLCSKSTPAMVLARNLTPLPEMVELCEEQELVLLGSSLSTMELINKATFFLMDEFSPIISKHGTLMEVYDVGVMIEGDSSVGKSEAALGLISKGHRLISDDMVRIKKKSENFLEGCGAELTRHLMEIRGIGIINVASLYGAFCVRDQKQIDIVVKLEEWSDDTFYDRIGLEEKKCEILGVKLPYSLLPVKPGRDVVLLIETLALNHRLKKMGFHSAKEFHARLADKIKANEVPS